MEIIDEGKEEGSEVVTQKPQSSKQKALQEMETPEESVEPELTPMEVEQSKDELSAEGNY